MKRCFSIFAIITWGLTLHGQEPGMNIMLSITKEGMLLQPAKGDSLHCIMDILEVYPMFSNSVVESHPLREFPSQYITTVFNQRISYRWDICRLVCVLGPDTMEVRFRLIRDSLQYHPSHAGYLFTTFNLTIPFQPGYYEVQRFHQPNTNSVFLIPEDFVWEPVPPGKRELFVRVTPPRR